MFLPSFNRPDDSQYNIIETKETIITYTMNDMEFNLNTFGTILEQAIDDSSLDRKVVFKKNINNKTTVTKTLKNQNGNHREIDVHNNNNAHQLALEKCHLKSLFNGDKNENVTIFKQCMLEYLELPFDKGFAIVQANTIKIILEKIIKSILENKPGKDIDSSIASDFYSKYMSSLMVFLLESLDYLLNSNNDIFSMFKNNYQFPMDFRKGLPKDSDNNNSMHEFAKCYVEDLIFGILKNAPIIRKNIESFPFYKVSPDLKVKAYQTLDDFEALANEYVIKLDINLTEVAQRNYVPFKCSIS